MLRLTAHGRVLFFFFHWITTTASIVKIVPCPNGYILLHFYFQQNVCVYACVCMYMYGTCVLVFACLWANLGLMHVEARSWHPVSPWIPFHFICWGWASHLNPEFAGPESTSASGILWLQAEALADWPFGGSEDPTYGPHARGKYFMHEGNPEN